MVRIALHPTYMLMQNVPINKAHYLNLDPTRIVIATLAPVRDYNLERRQSSIDYETLGHELPSTIWLLL